MQHAGAASTIGMVMTTSMAISTGAAMHCAASVRPDGRPPARHWPAGCFINRPNSGSFLRTEPSDALKRLVPHASLVRVAGAAHNDLQKFEAYREGYARVLAQL